jgi:hypothetical protein
MAEVLISENLNENSNEILTNDSKENFNEISKEKLTKITLEAQQKLDNKKNERFKIARQELINHITKDFSQKMIEAANNGFNQAILYSVGRAKDKSSNVDSDGNIVKFGENVWLSDILTKGENEIINDLNNFFNKDNKSDYHCFVTIKRDFKTNELKYKIFVSWASENNNKNNSIVYRGGKNNIYNKNKYNNNSVNSSKNSI